MHNSLNIQRACEKRFLIFHTPPWAGAGAQWAPFSRPSRQAGPGAERRPIPLLRRDRAVLKPNVSEGTKAYICERVNNRSRSGTSGLEDRYAANYTMPTFAKERHQSLSFRRLVNGVDSPSLMGKEPSSRFQGSNLGPSACKAGALPAELNRDTLF